MMETITVKQATIYLTLLYPTLKNPTLTSSPQLTQVATFLSFFKENYVIFEAGLHLAGLHTGASIR